MSSGPSVRNENPRSARSSWGDDTPRSTRKPSTGIIRSRSSTARASEKRACTRVTRSPNGSSSAPRRRDRRRIPVQADQSSVRRRAFEHRPRVTASPQRGIAVPAPGLRVQPGHRFCQQDRQVRRPRVARLTRIGKRIPGRRGHGGVSLFSRPPACQVFRPNIRRNFNEIRSKLHVRGRIPARARYVMRLTDGERGPGTTAVQLTPLD